MIQPERVSALDESSMPLEGMVNSCWRRPDPAVVDAKFAELVFFILSSASATSSSCGVSRISTSRRLPRRLTDTSPTEALLPPAPLH